MPVGKVGQTIKNAIHPVQAYRAHKQVKAEYRKSMEADLGSVYSGPKDFFTSSRLTLVRDGFILDNKNRYKLETLGGISFVILSNIFGTPILGPVEDTALFFGGHWTTYGILRAIDYALRERRTEKCRIAASSAEGPINKTEELSNIIERTAELNQIFVDWNENADRTFINDSDMKGKDYLTARQAHKYQTLRALREVRERLEKIERSLPADSSEAGSIRDRIGMLEEKIKLLEKSTFKEKLLENPIIAHSKEMEILEQCKIATKLINKLTNQLIINFSKIDPDVTRLTAPKSTHAGTKAPIREIGSEEITPPGKAITIPLGEEAGGTEPAQELTADKLASDLAELQEALDRKPPDVTKGGTVTLNKKVEAIETAIGQLIDLKKPYEKNLKNFELLKNTDIKRITISEDQRRTAIKQYEDSLPLLAQRVLHKLSILKEAEGQAKDAAEEVLKQLEIILGTKPASFQDADKSAPSLQKILDREKIAEPFRTEIEDLRDEISVITASKKDEEKELDLIEKDKKIEVGLIEEIKALGLDKRAETWKAIATKIADLKKRIEEAFPQKSGSASPDASSSDIRAQLGTMDELNGAQPMVDAVPGEPKEEIFTMADLDLPPTSKGPIIESGILPNPAAANGANQILNDRLLQLLSDQAEKYSIVSKAMQDAKVNLKIADDLGALLAIAKGLSGELGKLLIKDDKDQKIALENLLDENGPNLPGKVSDLMHSLLYREGHKEPASEIAEQAEETSAPQEKVEVDLNEALLVLDGMSKSARASIQFRNEISNLHREIAAKESQIRGLERTISKSAVARQEVEDLPEAVQILVKALENHSLEEERLNELSIPQLESLVTAIKETITIIKSQDGAINELTDKKEQIEKAQGEQYEELQAIKEDYEAIIPILETLLKRPDYIQSKVTARALHEIVQFVVDTIKKISREKDETVKSLASNKKLLADAQIRIAGLEKTIKDLEDELSKLKGKDDKAEETVTQEEGEDTLMRDLNAALVAAELKDKKEEPEIK